MQKRTCTQDSTRSAGLLTEITAAIHYRSAASRRSGTTSFRTKSERLETNDESEHVSCVKKTYKNKAQADPSLQRKELLSFGKELPATGPHASRWLP